VLIAASSLQKCTRDIGYPEWDLWFFSGSPSKFWNRIIQEWQRSTANHKKQALLLTLSRPSWTGGAWSLLRGKVKCVSHICRKALNRCRTSGSPVCTARQREDWGNVQGSTENGCVKLYSETWECERFHYETRGEWGFILTSECVWNFTLRLSWAWSFVLKSWGAWAFVLRQGVREFGSEIMGCVRFHSDTRGWTIKKCTNAVFQTSIYRCFLFSKIPGSC
jgi:hypothetical protein